MKQFYFSFITFFILSLWAVPGLGQAVADNSQSVEMADIMRASGKIYVVVLVVALVFSGIVIYLISLDRKVSKLEKEVQNIYQNNKSDK
jgi:CcmD family protein